MHSATWHREAQHARLHAPGLSARFAAARAGDGLCQVAPAGETWAEARLLGVTAKAIAPRPNDGSAEPIEWHCRGTDLLAAWEEPGGADRVNVLWRCVRPAESGEFLAAIDLIVSVRTESLAGRPDVILESRVPPCDVLRLTDVEAAAFVRWSPGESAVAATYPLDCHWFRPAGCPGATSRWFIRPTCGVTSGSWRRAKRRPCGSAITCSCRGCWRGG